MLAREKKLFAYVWVVFFQFFLCVAPFSILQTQTRTHGIKYIHHVCVTEFAATRRIGGVWWGRLVCCVVCGFLRVCVCVLCVVGLSPFARIAPPSMRITLELFAHKRMENIYAMYIICVCVQSHTHTLAETCRTGSGGGGGLNGFCVY